MYLLISILILAFLVSFWMGFRRLVQFHHLNRKRVVNGIVVGMILLTLITTGHWLGLVPQEWTARFTMVLYIIVAGFFFGFAIKLILLRQKLQSIKYIYQSFWTNPAPKIIAALIVIFGIYRTGLFTFEPYTGIGITSGLSLVGFGVWGFTLRIVPEFRRNGILILDQIVYWKKVIAYRWESENVLQIDYYTGNNNLTDFTTYIPPEDRTTVEQLLSEKLIKHEKDRISMMNVDDDQG
jgi:hypothetical protein